MCCHSSLRRASSRPPAVSSARATPLQVYIATHHMHISHPYHMTLNPSAHHIPCSQAAWCILQADVDALLADGNHDASAADTTVKVDTKPVPDSQDAKQVRQSHRHCIVPGGTPVATPFVDVQRMYPCSVC